MTALKGYQRLEATGLWRENAQAQRREVIVSLGDATLTIADTAGRALTHWSLAAVVRANRGNDPALFHPEGDADEVLELAASEVEMIAGIDTLIAAIERRRPHPGKLRWVLALAFAGAVGAAAILWLPDALIRHATAVVPPVKRAEIGRALLQDATRVTGSPCDASGGQEALQKLGTRVLGADFNGRLVVVPDGVRDSAHLPGGLILLNRAVLEDHEDPDVPAGYVLAESLRAQAADPLADLLAHAGLWPTLRLLTTGALPDDALADYAEHLMLSAPAPVDDDVLLAAFGTAELRSTPYAYARDITGETVLALIEADPRAREGSRRVLSDSDWLRLQAICGG